MSTFGNCLNWRVVAGLGAVAVGVVVVAPNLLLAALPALLVLACSLSCLCLTRGSRRRENQDHSMNRVGAQPTTALIPLPGAGDTGALLSGSARDTRIAELNARSTM